MAIINNEQAIANAAAIQQGVQAAIAAAPVASITNAPVVLPATGAAPQVESAPVNVEAPNVGNATPESTGDATATAAVSSDAAPVELTKAQQLQGKIDALTKRIDADTKKREQLEALLRSADLLDSVKSGSVIVAKVGRAETAREVVATVTGVQVLESGDKRFKIFFGEGFEAETVVIQESQIADIRQA